jgi:hypothetical protein
MLPVGLVNWALAPASTLPTAKCCIAWAYVVGGCRAAVVVVDDRDVVEVLDGVAGGVTVTVVVSGVVGWFPPPQALTAKAVRPIVNAAAMARRERVRVVR